MSSANSTSDPAAPVLASVVIPTRNRHAFLDRAVASALAQAPRAARDEHPHEPALELDIIVVDDGSEPPVEPATDPRVRILRQPHRGTAEARNAGLAAARGLFTTYLDDDDTLAPGAISRALIAHRQSKLPAPVGVLAGLAEVTSDGRVIGHRLPPTMAAGTAFPLTELDRGRSHGVKQTLVVPTQVLRDVGGWDANFESRVTTELFMRLGEVCSFQGIDEIGYFLTVHDGARISRNPILRQESWHRLGRVHAARFAQSRRGAAALALAHARTSWQQDQRMAAAQAVLQAIRYDPTRVATGVLRAVVLASRWPFEPKPSRVTPRRKDE